MSFNGLYVGIMSGTSVDAVDAALVEINNNQCRLIDTATTHYSSDLRESLLQLNTNPVVTLPNLISLDKRVATTFAKVTLQLLAQSKTAAMDICAIGSHGQTIYHQPNTDTDQHECRGTLQIGDPNTIAHATQIDVVADFRRADMARGGQGAPLTPAFHHCVLGSTPPRVILNLGGIANISLLDNTVTGFDTGPANTMLDAWSQARLGRSYDSNGDWANSGNIQHTLLDNMLADSYFHAPPPKSTGPDYFNLEWLGRFCDPDKFHAEDIQATLVELTATTAAQAILKHAPDSSGVFVCGGGARNGYLMERLAHHLSPLRLGLTDDLGINGAACESMAFAWLAYRYKCGLSGNNPDITGADSFTVLGGLYPGKRI